MIFSYIPETFRNQLTIGKFDYVRKRVKNYWYDCINSTRRYKRRTIKSLTCSDYVSHYEKMAKIDLF